MTNQTQKHTFHVYGMHCNACVLMTESELGDLPNITHVKSSLKNHSVEVTGDFGDKTEVQIAEDLTTSLKPHGYTVSVEKNQHNAKWEDFKIALPIALGFAVLFVLLQKLGIVNLVGGGNVTYGTAFIIGIIASLSTCMAVVGGLVLSMSATFAKEGDKIRPQLMFHGGRIVSFFILGGVIGAIGSAFTLNTSLSTQDKIEFAAQFATQKFETVGRKNHFLEVCDILRNEFKVSDENTLVAGILHDTVEDTNTSFEEIEQNFSKEVALLVDEVSHPKDYSGVQVQEYYEKLKHISLPAKMIKLADFLSHLRRLIGIYQRGEEASNPVFVENGRYARDIIAVAETCPPSEAREIVIKLAHELLELHEKSPVWGV